MSQIQIVVNKLNSIPDSRPASAVVLDADPLEERLPVDQVVRTSASHRATAVGHLAEGDGHGVAGGPLVARPVHGARPRGRPVVATHATAGEGDRRRGVVLRPEVDHGHSRAAEARRRAEVRGLGHLPVQAGGDRRAVRHCNEDEIHIRASNLSEFLRNRLACLVKTLPLVLQSSFGSLIKCSLHRLGIVHPAIYNRLENSF